MLQPRPVRIVPRALAGDEDRARLAAIGRAAAAPRCRPRPLPFLTSSASMRRLLAATVLLATACRGGDSVPERRSFVDSRDTYDPVSYTHLTLPTN